MAKCLILVAALLSFGCSGTQVAESVITPGTSEVKSKTNDTRPKETVIRGNLKVPEKKPVVVIKIVLPPKE